MTPEEINLFTKICSLTATEEDFFNVSEDYYVVTTLLRNNANVLTSFGLKGKFSNDMIGYKIGNESILYFYLLELIDAKQSLYKVSL